MIIGITCTVNVMYWNHPETSPLAQSMGKLSSMKRVSGAKNVGNC